MEFAEFKDALQKEAKKIKVIVTDEKAEIISGINAGDKVVVEGKEYLSETNNTIKIVE